MWTSRQNLFRYGRGSLEESYLVRHVAQRSAAKNQLRRLLAETRVVRCFEVHVLARPGQDERNVGFLPPRLRP